MRLEYRSRLAALAVSALALATCGEESSNGSLCQRCSDGFNFGSCQPSVTIEVTSETNAPSFCEVPPPGADAIPCEMNLQCLSLIGDEAIRRCFPVDPATSELDAFYRCDGARPVQ